MSTESLIIQTHKTDSVHTSAFYELRELAHKLITCNAQHIKVYTKSEYLHQNFGRFKTWRERGWLNSRKQPVKYVEMWKRVDAGCIGKTVEIMDESSPYSLLVIGAEVVSDAMCEYARRLAQIAADQNWQIVTGRSDGFEQALKQAAESRGVAVVQPESVGAAIQLADRAVCAISSKHPERDNIVELLAQQMDIDVLDFAATF